MTIQDFINELYTMGFTEDDEIVIKSPEGAILKIIAIQRIGDTFHIFTERQVNTA